LPRAEVAKVVNQEEQPQFRPIGHGFVACKPVQFRAYLHSFGWVQGKRFGIIGVIVTGQTAVDELSEQRNEVASDISAGTAFREIAGSDMGQAQGIIQFSIGQMSRAGGDSGAAKFQADLGVELDPRRGFFAVAYQGLPNLLR
jgi:hypothetical protein